MSAPSRSVIVMIPSKPRSVGNGPMKSIATESPRWSGTGSGCRGPVGFVVRLLLRAHSGQAGFVDPEVAQLVMGEPEDGLAKVGDARDDETIVEIQEAISSL